MVESHADYWVAVTTAGPVIAVAHTLLIERVLRRGGLHKDGNKRHENRVLVYAAMFEGMGLMSTVIATAVGLHALRFPTNYGPTLDLGMFAVLASLFTLLIAAMLVAAVRLD